MHARPAVERVSAVSRIVGPVNILVRDGGLVFQVSIRRSPDPISSQTEPQARQDHVAHFNPIPRALCTTLADRQSCSW